MPTTISLPTIVSGGPTGFNGSNLFTDDETNTTGHWINTATDVTLSGFNSLSVPSGATINGIEVVVDGQGNTGNFIPLMKVYNGTSWSNGLPFQGDFAKSNAEYDPGWGSSSNLWGLTWNTSTANAIQIQVDNSTMFPPGTQMYWDWVKVRITYTDPTPLSNGKITLSSGLVQLTNGKITL